jgi:hypothetical protein
VVLDSPDSEEESGEACKEEGRGVEPGSDSEAPPLADLAKVVGWRDVLEEAWNKDIKESLQASKLQTCLQILEKSETGTH